MSEDLKQPPPASIESDAPSEYMRGYSDGLAQAEARIAVLARAFSDIACLASEAAELLNNENAR